jgi:hypothetical protein
MSIFYLPKPFKRNNPSLRPVVIFHNMLVFYSEELAVCQMSMLEDHSFPAVCDCLFDIFASILLSDYDNK